MDKATEPTQEIKMSWIVTWSQMFGDFEKHCFITNREEDAKNCYKAASVKYSDVKVWEAEQLNPTVTVRF